MSEGKVRMHIKVSEDEELTFEKTIQDIEVLAKEIIEDDVVSFLYIQEGLKEGNVNFNYNGDDSLITEEGTMMRFFTKNTKWSFILIKRERKNGFITLIDITAPKKDEKIFNIMIERILEITKGEIGGSI